MSGATDLNIKFSPTEQGEESKTTLEMKPHWVWKPFQRVSGQLTNTLFSNSQSAIWFFDQL